MNSRRYEQLLVRISAARSDANIEFNDLRNLPLHLGFEERTRGSHHLFRKAGIPERVNIQRDGHLAKAH